MLLLKQVSIVFITSYVLILIFVYFKQESFIFFPVQSDHNTPADGRTQDYTLQRQDNVLRGWLVNPELATNRLVLYYGGNAEDIYYNIDDFSIFPESGALLVNYRGYGGSSGKPGEKELFADALAVYDDSVRRYNPQKIIVMGRSLGSGVAAYVAAQRKVTGVIMITPYDSIAGMARRQFPFLPTSALLRHPFRSIDYVQLITAPSLIIHGGKDTIIPRRNTEKLLEHFRTAPEIVFIEEGDHNDIEQFPQYKKAVHSFIEKN